MPQRITTPAGEELVLLSRTEYETLVRAAEEAAEDAADVAIYDARKAVENGPVLPAEVTMAMLKGQSRLKAMRLWRDVGQVYLANRIGTSQGFISDLENGRRAMSEEVRRRISEVLQVPEAWL